MSGENPLIAKCPQCQSSFRLSAQHLEAAKGWVQCGVCGHVFFSGLTPPAKAEEPPPAAPAPVQEPQESEYLAIVPGGQANDKTATHKEAAEALEDIEINAGASSPALSGLSHRMAEDSGPPTTGSRFGPKLESIILMDGAAQDDHDPGPLPVIPPRPEPPRPGQAQPAPNSRRGGYHDADATRPVGSWMPRQDNNRKAKPQQKKNSFNFLWSFISVLLILLLLVQLAWFQRDSLAANHPTLRPLLTEMCLALDCTVRLPRNTDKVTILGSDLQTENNGQLLLTLTLANRAQTSMAWPVLELTLTDVEDQPLARRVFAPSEYLPSVAREAQGISRLSEVPITLNLNSSDVKAAGYRLRMFY